MMPDNTPAATPHVTGFLYPVKGPGDAAQDWEMGGKWLNDPSEGLQVKLWHVAAIYNNGTDTIDVVLDAPGGVAVGEPKRVLFSGADITEVSLAFDQNMNPCIAYMQGSAAKLLWYDPTIPGMTHTTLPAGTYDVRVTLDDKRPFATGDSDIVLAYLRGGTLYIRYQRDRFNVEYTYKTGIGPNAQLVSMAMNSNSCLQFRLRKSTLSAGEGVLVEARPYLADVVQDILMRSGVDVKSIDVSKLWTPIEGYKIATEAGADALIAPLREAWFFDPYESDKKLRFVPRGKREPITRITKADLLEATSGRALEVTRLQEAELLRKVNITAIDSSIDYVQNTQTASRTSATVQAKSEQTTALPVTVSPDFQASVALRKIKTAWGEMLTYKFAVPVRFSFLTPTDVVELETAHGISTIRVLQIEEDSGRLEIEAIENAGWAYSANAEGAQAAQPEPTTPGLVGETVLEIINAAVQRDQDDELGLYFAAVGTGSGWRGYQVFASVDGGANYDVVLINNLPANIGVIDTAITAEDRSFSVVVPEQLESVTDEAMAVGRNRAFVGAEEIQYKTASFVEMVGEQYRYTISGVRRGIMESDIDEWTADTRFIAVDDAVMFLQIQRAYFGQTIYYKAVSLGQDADEVDPVAFTFDHAESQTEWPVRDVVVINESSGLSVSWTPNPRLGSFGNAPFQSKYFTGYRVEFSDGHKIDTTDTHVTYASGAHNTEVKVYGLNDITGEGKTAYGHGDFDPAYAPVFADGIYPPTAVKDEDETIQLEGD